MACFGLYVDVGISAWQCGMGEWLPGLEIIAGLTDQFIKSSLPGTVLVYT